MRARLCRLLLTCVFATILGINAPASDILLNTDFRDGKTHWQGGGTEPSNMGGKLLVELDPKKWTVIYQHFSTRASVLRLEMVYLLSADCTLGQSEAGSVFTSSDLVDACGLHDDFTPMPLTSHQLGLAFTVSSGSITSMDYIYPSLSHASPGVSQPATSRRVHNATIQRWWGTEFENEELCLAFPPGTGTVTLLKVALTKIGD